jgi:choline-sulfatase
MRIGRRIGFVALVLGCVALQQSRLLSRSKSHYRSNPPLAALISDLPPAASQPAARRPAGKPNLLLIIADDQGADTLGLTGDPRHATPNLDALARQGVLFERAYCNAPLCTPSRQALITGKLPHSLGVTQLKSRLSDQVLTMGEWFSGHGYRTVAIGKMHFNGPSRHGFQERIDSGAWERDLKEHPPAQGDQRRPWRPFDDPPRVWMNAAGHSAGLPATSMQSAYFVDRAARIFNEQKDRPFAMVVGFYDPHCPYYFPREWRGRFLPEQFKVPTLSDFDRTNQPAVFAALTPADVRGVQASYFTALSFMDYQVGRLISALDQAGLASDTLVIFVGDNGYMLGQHGRFEKHCFYEPAVRIPLIFRWPGRLPAEARRTELVEMVDLFPTACRLLAIDPPPSTHGVDLVPVLDRTPGAHGRDFVFSEYLENEEAMVRSDRYKLIVGSGRRARQDGYQTARILPPTGPYERLFDLASDPEEIHDLSDDPALAKVKEALLEKMHERLVSTREGLEPFPTGLSPRAEIDWCLMPRDH